MIDGKAVIGITQGDANGVGYEVMLRALVEPHFTEQFVPIIYGSGRVVSYYKKVLGLPGLNFQVIQSPAQAQPRRINLIESLTEEFHVEMGEPTRAAGEAARQALERFLTDWRGGGIDALVTLPVNKQAMQGADFQFPGHTEYLAAATEGEPLMMMVSDRLRLGVVTGHMPLAKVPEAITEELILQRLRILRESLRRDFEIENPRIAILALNPHAGEHGLLGLEEEDIIEPAIAQANKEGMIAVGPFAADGFFGAGQWVHYDAVLAMYHDQGLVPFKTIAFEGGVNFTAGLSLVRTSPAHGTAYGLVGKGVASCIPFREAVYAAMDIARRRARTDTLRAGALPPRDAGTKKEE